MATPRSRRAARHRAGRRRAQHRARRLAVIGIVAALALVTLILTAFGSSSPNTDATTVASAAPATTGVAPKPQALATVGNLQIKLPIASDAVTAIGFHGAAGGAIELSPVGRQANEGLLARLWRRIAGSSQDGPVWFQLDGGPGTEVLDVGAIPGTDVYAPVDGTVVSISAFVIDGKRFGSRIDVRPTSAPSLIVSLNHLQSDPSLAVGSTVMASSSKLGTVVDVAAVERQALAKYARDRGDNVAIEVHPTAGSLP